MSGPADNLGSAEALLQALQPEEAALARSMRTRVLALGTVGERIGIRELVYVVLAGAGAEVARLQLKPGAASRLTFTGDREPIELSSLQAAAIAAEAVRTRAEALAARAPQMSLFGRKP